MKIKDFLDFNKKKYFGGAVQANWFYEEDKVKFIAESYVFHGPKFHGVSDKETTNTNYRLFDTSSYALELLKKSKDRKSNRFNMTIAGYGTGKSHLSVALGGLLSGHDGALRDTVVNAIISVDKGIGEEIKSYTDKNLVLVLNGMRNFNLNSEILSVAKKALSLHGLSTDIFAELTKQYQQAIAFVKKTYVNEKENYDRYLKEYKVSNADSIDTIIEKLENADTAVFNAVNSVYKEFMGTYINVESDISAADILTLLSNKYCIEDKVFSNIYILFDEFGRYIEFTANNPQIAGDSSLQQIFEAIQNANGHIIFDAFIQSDLNSYIRRVESSNANISRYVGRYENSDKYYLSSNFETVLANLIEKTDAVTFENTVERNVSSTYPGYFKNLYLCLNNWAKPDITNRNVWNNEKMFMDVIAKGSYPLHPMTVWFLANTSSWMQQRSTIAYTSEMFERIQNEEIESAWLPYINPTDVIDTGLFNEMLNSEEKGLVSSQNCMSYNSIITQYGDKLFENEVKVLKSILVINILKLKLNDRNSCNIAIKYCSGLEDEDIETAINKLENDYCIISYDNNTNRFDLNAEAHGKQEYSLMVIKKQAMLKFFDPVSDLDEELLMELKLQTPENTSFAMENSIASSEWQFEKKLINCKHFDGDFCRSLKYHFENAIDGEQYRGILVYIYFGKEFDTSKEAIINLVREYKLMDYPLIINVLDDRENELTRALKRRAVLKSFSLSERDTYAKFLNDDLKSTLRTIVRLFNSLTSERKFLTDKKVEESANRINIVCHDNFKRIYTMTIPFAFDGFEKKVSPASKKNLRTMCSSMYSGTICNKQAYQGFDPKDKNRIQAVLSTATPTSWQVFDSKFTLCEPKNSKVKKLYNDVMEKILPDNQYTISDLFSEYRYAPYGLNQYSLLLFIVYVLSYNGSKIQIFEGTLPLSKSNFIEKYLSSDKKVLENILKLRISLRTQSDDEKLKLVFDEIEKLNYIEFCPGLQKKLDDITENMDDLGDHKAAISVARMKLKDGLEQYRRLYNTLDNAEKALKDCKEAFKIQAVIQVLLKLKPHKADFPIDEGGDFVYSEGYCNRINSVLAEANVLLDSNFTAAVSSLKCNYSQSSEFKKIYSNAARDLNTLGKKEYANILKERISKVLEEAELQEKYSKTLADVQQFITQTLPAISTYDFKESEKMLNTANGWIDMFEGSKDMIESVRQEIINKIKDIRAKILLRKNNLNAQVTSVMSEISNPTLPLSQLREKINSAINLQPDEKEMIKLRNTSEQIEEFLRFKSSYVNSDNRGLAELENAFNEKWCSTVCSKSMREWINTLKIQSEVNRKKWMSENVDDVLCSLDRMNVTQLIQWRSSVLELPDYLSEDDLNKVSELSHLITKKIQSHRINGVVEMFNSLTDEEKKECLRLISNN